MDTNRCTVTSTTIGMFTGEAKYQPKRCPNTAVVFDGLLGHCGHHRAAFAQLSRRRPEGDDPARRAGLRRRSI
jgi:hypothetical protein